MATTFLLLFVLLIWLVILWTTIRDNISAVVLKNDTYKDLPPIVPHVSIIIPARNEERNISRCLSSVLSNDYPAFDVVVVDDRSSDRTSGIVESLAREDKRVTLVKGGQLPAGWVGKNFAIYQGIRQASGEWLLFTDADTCHSPQVLRQTLSFAIDNGIDMVTIMPHLECDTFWEKVVQPVVIGMILTFYPPFLVNDPKSKVCIANGQFILIRRDVYDAIGGHQRIKDRIIDDQAICENVKGSGFRVKCLLATELMTTRMYTNLREIWFGWSKSCFVALKASLIRVCFCICFIIATGVLPFVTLVFSAILIASGNASRTFLVIFWLSLLIFAVILTIRLLYGRKIFRMSATYSLSYPLGALMLTAIVLYSAFHGTLGRGAVWKGRTYK
jgi:chlorobactene glucosyltransferase